MDDIIKINDRINTIVKNQHLMFIAFKERIENIESDVRRLKIKKNLSDREHQVYELLLAEKKPVEIAKMLCLTKGRISQIVKQLKKKGLVKFR